MRSALVLVGYGLGALVYLALALWALRSARYAVRALVALYWRDRSRREVRATVQRVAAEAAPPQRRAA